MVDKSNEAFQQLSQNQKRLGDIINTNIDAIRGAFTFTDAHLHIHRRILNDMRRSSPRVTPLHPDDAAWLLTGPTWEEERMRIFQHVPDQEIDYTWYAGQYHGWRFVMLFIHGIRKLLGMEEEDEKKDEDLQPDLPGGDDFVFGGDYAYQDSSASEGSGEDGDGDHQDLDGGRDAPDEVHEVPADGSAHQDAGRP